MFAVSMEDISAILRDFNVPGEAAAFTELQRYHYEKHDPESKEVRLIIKVEIDDGRSVVIRYKNEKGVSLDLINAQSCFARLLSDNGVETPKLYQTNGRYARWYSIGGYDVVVTVEDYVEGELQAVDEETAARTGRLLARMHNIAEKADFHVSNDVLFDPLGRNDLFGFSEFAKHERLLMAADAVRYQDIVRTYGEYIQMISVFQDEQRYAVQGDISECNLYETAKGVIGIFDFNRCGDNILYFDAIMQAVFEARLMDYPAGYEDRTEERILPAFLRGYHQERPFSARQRERYPYLYALISAFWLGDMRWSENSLRHAAEEENMEELDAWLKEIQKRIHFLPDMPL